MLLPNALTSVLKHVIQNIPTKFVGDVSLYSILASHRRHVFIYINIY